MSEIICWEAIDADAPEVQQARRLYELTQAPDERIPWEWIERGVRRRAKWRPGKWSPHLLLAGPEGGDVVGFCCGMSLPNYGGYLSYLGTDPGQRGKGVAGRLIELLVSQVRADAAGAGEEVPFVVWESRAPKEGDSDAVAMWRARLRLFAKAGAMWLRGVTFHAERYDGGEGAVLLQLFVRPVARRPEEVDLVGVVRGLAENVYRLEGDHPFVAASLPGGDAALVPPGEAEGLRASGPSTVI